MFYSLNNKNTQHFLFTRRTGSLMSKAFVSSLQNVSTKASRIIYSIGHATDATAEVASMTEIIKRKYLKDARLATN